MQQEFQALTSKKDHIQLDGIQKIKELEPEDKYKVLEFLVKEMLEIKQQRPPEYRDQDRYYHRYPDERSSGRDRGAGDFRTLSHLDNQRLDGGREDPHSRQRERSRSHIDHYKSPINRKPGKRVSVEQLDESRGQGIVESISVEDEAVITSRKDADSKDGERDYGLPHRHGTVRVNKAAHLNTADARGSKFTNQSPPPNQFNATIKSGTSLDQGDSYYDQDEFESVSMSKSMGGLGLGLTGAKPAQSAGLAGRGKDLAKKKSDVTKSSAGGDEYSDD